MNVLFIADGSLSNPILQSQGIPHIIENSRKGINFFVLSFEELPFDPSSQKWYDEAILELEGKARIISVELNKHFFLSQIKAVYFFLLGLIKGIQIVRKYKIDVIHGRSNRPSLIGLVIKVFFRTKVLFDNRGLVSDEIDSHRFLRIKTERFFEKILLKYSDAVVVVSKVFKDYLTNKFDFMIGKKNISVIRNSFSEKRFKFSLEIRNQHRELYKLSSKLVMVYSGPSIGWQRFDLVIDTFKILKKIKKNAFLMVVSYEPEIGKKVLDSGIDKSDFKVFNVSAKEVNKHLLAGDFGVIFRDNRIRSFVCAPIKLGEYLASGLPIFCMSKIGDTEEIVRKYEIGVIVEKEDELFGDSLNQIIELCNKPGIKSICRSAAETELSLSFAANQYFQIYNTLKNRRN